MKIKITLYAIIPILCVVMIQLQAQPSTFVYGDALPDAPTLSTRGEYKVGVKTMDFTNTNQLDVLNTKEGKEVFYDRKLKVEIWYPSVPSTDESKLETYQEVMGSSNDVKRPLIPFTFYGRAEREAKLKSGDEAFPLIIVSHGYLGSRYLMTYLTENLASKGYIVVAIDHTESTFRDAAGFASTLLNRSKDILFILNQMAQLNANDPIFKRRIDVNNTGLIGYSMGGYGVLNAAGAGYSDGSVKMFTMLSGGSDALKERTGSNDSYQKSLDPRIKAVVAFAPWGMERGVWDSISLKGLKVPTFFIAGDQDDISGYEKGVKAIYEGAKNAERYLLVYHNARHNVAPNPAPPESLQTGLHIDEYYRYAEPSWDQRKINNINQHFVTAFMGQMLKKQDHNKFLQLPENSNAKTWEGFKPRSSVGLSLKYSKTP
jgi:predicted dienelactone hydrolase